MDTVQKSKAYEPIVETEVSPEKKMLVPYREFMQPETYNSNTIGMVDNMNPTGISKQDLIQDQLQFLVKKGVLETDTSEFEHFKRQNVTRWGTISQILDRIEKWIGQYNIMFAYINAQKLVELAECQPERYTKEELLSCMANKA